MEAAQFIRGMIDDLHRGIRAEVEPLTQEQFLHRPTEEANSVAFLLWHFTRMEDDVIHRQAGGAPSVWAGEKWYEKLGMEASDMGTGFTAEQVAAFQPAKEDVLGYSERVWEEVPDLVSGLSNEDLDRPLNPERPRMTVGRSLGNFVLGHGFWHLGDIRFIKGLLGMPFSR